MHGICVAVSNELEIGAAREQVFVHTRTAADIVQSKVRDALVHLEEKRQRLANATGGTEDGHLGQLETHGRDVSKRRGKASG